MPSIPIHLLAAGTAPAASVPEPAREGGNSDSAQAPRGEALPQAGRAGPVGGQEAAASTSQKLGALQQRLQEQALPLRRKLEFDFDRNSRELVIKVRDAETGRLIRQIPPQEVVDLAERLAETVGVLFRSVV